MAGFRKTESRAPAAQQRSSGYSRQKPQADGDEYKAQRVSGLFRREGKYGTFWVSADVDGFEYRVSINPEYEKDPERQNEFILFKAKRRPRD